MASEQDRKDFARRGSFRPPVVPIKKLPTFSTTINIRRPEDHAAWKRMDDSLDEWRKTLQVPIGSAGGALSAPSETTETPSQSSVIIQQIGSQPPPQSELHKFDDLVMQNASDAVGYGVKLRTNADGNIEWFLSPEAIFLRNVSDGKVYEVFIRNNADGNPELIPGESYENWEGGTKGTWNEVLDRILARLIPSNLVYEIKLRNNPDGLPELFIGEQA